MDFFFLQSNLQIQTDGTAIIAFVFYLAVLVGIGLYSARFSSQGISEFFVGAGKMNRFVVALSAVVSGRSAWLLLAFSGMAYKMGAAAIWAAVGYILVELWMFLYYAPRLRAFSGENDVITVPDFYAARFGDKDNLLRLICVFIIVIFMVAYVSSQFVAGGKAFAASFDMTPENGMLLSAIIILLYTLIGGFLAVSLTDVVQAIFMIIALVAIPAIAISNYGGWEIVRETVLGQQSTFLDPMSIATASLIGFVGIGLGSPGSPHILVRYMSIDDPSQFKFAAAIGTFWNVVMAAGAFFIGIVGRAYFPDIAQLPGADAENLYPTLAQMNVSPVLFGIIVASIFAAIMSTADSQLLVGASSLVRDFYQKIYKNNEDIPNNKLVLYSRISVIIMVIFSLFLGYIANDLVFWLVLFAWGGLGASIGATSILALFWPGTTRSGVIAGMITGTVVIFIWRNIPMLKDTMYELIPGFFLAMLVTVVVSLMTNTERD